MNITNLKPGDYVVLHEEEIAAIDEGKRLTFLTPEMVGKVLLARENELSDERLLVVNFSYSRLIPTL